MINRIMTILSQQYKPGAVFVGRAVDDRKLERDVEFAAMTQRQQQQQLQLIHSATECLSEAYDDRQPRLRERHS